VITLLLSNWKLVLVGLLVLALGIQSYRLQGAQGEVQVLQAEAKARQDRDALRELQNLKNKERTDEEYLAARKRRASTSVVRVDGPGIKPRETVPSQSGPDPIACFDRGKLNEELAGLYERLSQRLTGIAREGEGVAADYRACQAWAVGLN
jgi:hypothetical protein